LPPLEVIKITEIPMAVLIPRLSTGGGRPNLLHRYFSGAECGFFV
jgi:hypothetical protein